MVKSICYIQDINDTKKRVYDEPIYSKLDGVYGYIVVSNYKVLFFWVYNETPRYDDVTDKFKVEYVYEKVD